MRIQLSYTDPASQTPLRPVLETPVAIGSAFGEMPNLLGGDRVSRLTLNHPQIAPYHLLLIETQGRLQAIAQDPSSGFRVNGQPQTMAYVNLGDRLQVGPCELQVIRIEPDISAPPPSPPPPSAASPRAASDLDLAAAMTTAPRRPPAAAAPPAGIGPNGCDRRIGFLFPRRCGRLSAAGCPYCDSGRIADEPFFRYDDARSVYTDYGRYDAQTWGGQTSPGNREIDFTEADAASLELLGDDFEQDLGAS